MCRLQKSSGTLKSDGHNFAITINRGDTRTYSHRLHLQRTLHIASHRYAVLHEEYWQRSNWNKQGVDMIVADDAACRVIW
jgi:hypothetical protein